MLVYNTTHYNNNKLINPIGVNQCELNACILTYKTVDELSFLYKLLREVWKNMFIGRACAKLNLFFVDKFGLRFLKR